VDLLKLGIEQVAVLRGSGNQRMVHALMIVLVPGRAKLVAMDRDPQTIIDVVECEIDRLAGAQPRHLEHDKKGGEPDRRRREDG
jgi:hypothetical protein